MRKTILVPKNRVSGRSGDNLANEYLTGESDGPALVLRRVFQGWWSQWKSTG